MTNLLEWLPLIYSLSNLYFNSLLNNSIEKDLIKKIAPKVGWGGVEDLSDLDTTDIKYLTGASAEVWFAIISFLFLLFPNEWLSKKIFKTKKRKSDNKELHYYDMKDTYESLCPSEKVK